MSCFAVICGIKNSGKTTLTEKLVRILTGRGLRVAVLKHDGHDFDCDLPGTDSYRFVEAGACGAAVFSRSQLFVRKLGSFPDMGEDEYALPLLRRVMEAFPDADVILGEGFKGLSVPKIEVIRSAVSWKPASNPKGRFLIVSDLPQEAFGETTLPFEAPELIADAILENGARELIADAVLENGARELITDKKPSDQ